MGLMHGLKKWVLKSTIENHKTLLEQVFYAGFIASCNLHSQEQFTPEESFQAYYKKLLQKHSDE